jgi:uncharacterized UPF0160 family protein
MKIPGSSFFKTKKLIVTHDSNFHTDDVFAAATLSLYFEKTDQPFIIRRSRDKSDIEKADIVFDVGFVYDAEKGRFDHHQSDGAGIRENGVPYAAFGLVWKHFGLALLDQNKNIWKAVDDQLATPIDAPDNGFSLTEQVIPNIQPFYLGDVISVLFSKGQDPDKEFFQAVIFAKKLMTEFIERIKAGEEVKDRILDEYESSDDKKIVVAGFPTTRQMMWVALKEKTDVLFGVFQSKTNSDWNIVAMRKTLNSFGNRKDMPESWGGLQEVDLQKVTGVPDAVFCHRNLFLASARSKKGAIALAELAVNN